MEKRHLAVVTSRHATPQIELWAAGNDQLASFAVCGHGGRPLWYSRFSADHGLHPAWKTVSAQTVAATKAIWLAGRSGSARDPSRVRLLLHLSDPDVDSLALADVAAKAGVAYRTDVVWGSPALEWCNAPGRAEWRESDLSNLASHRSPHAPFYRGRMMAGAAAVVVAAAAIAAIIALNHHGDPPAASGSVAASAAAIMGGMPAPLRSAASCTPRSVDGRAEENCVIAANDPMIEGLLAPGHDGLNFAALMEPEPSKIVADWQQRYDDLRHHGSTVVRIDDHAPGGVGVETIDTRSGLDVQLSGFATHQDAADFVARAGW